MQISELVIGKKYTITELRQTFGGSFQGGMNTCKKTNCLVLISKHNMSRIYGDEWNNGQLIYTGRGQHGDQQYHYENKSLGESNKTGLVVYLFCKERANENIFFGQVVLDGDVYQVQEPDVDRKMRSVYKFPLTLLSHFRPLQTEEMDRLRGGSLSGSIKKEYDVVGAAILKDGKVLCTQRGHGDLKGKWEFPGGKIENGESATEALHREIKEELNIDIFVGDLIGKSSFEYSDKIIHLSVYEAKIVKGEIEDHEHTALSWKSSSEVMTLDWADSDIPIAEMVVDLLPRSIHGKPEHFDYFKAEPIQPGTSQYKRSLQDYEKSERSKHTAGDNAERAALQYEKDRLLNLMRPDLESRVERVSLKSSDYGYDISSFQVQNGEVSELHIEVKSATVTENYLTFFISENELKHFKNDKYYAIYCLYKVGKYYKLHIVDYAAFFKTDYLTPMSYMVRIRINS